MDRRSFMRALLGAPFLPSIEPRMWVRMDNGQGVELDERHWPPPHWAKYKLASPPQNLMVRSVGPWVDLRYGEYYGTPICTKWCHS